MVYPAYDDGAIKLILLAKLEGLLIGGAVFLSVLIAANFKGQGDARNHAKQRMLETQIKINRAVVDKRKQNEVDHDEAVQKTDAGDFSGFDRKPDGVHGKR